MDDEGSIPVFLSTGEQGSLSEQRQSRGSRAGLDQETDVIIWTPAFIALFALVLVVGLSMTTILLQGWLNGHYSDTAVLLAYTPVLFCLWTTILLKASSPWARMGGFFGCLWSFFMAGSYWFHLLTGNTETANVGRMNLAAYSALLATFICLSLAHTPFRRWDRWFFRLLPLITVIILSASSLRVLKTAGTAGALHKAEDVSTLLLLSLCSAIWWLRPSCWRSQPGPAFLFGIAPLLLLLFVIPHLAGGEQIFFFQQFFLLCILLGAIRILQGELQYRATARAQSNIDAMQGQDQQNGAKTVVHDVQYKARPE